MVWFSGLGVTQDSAGQNYLVAVIKPIGLPGRIGSLSFIEIGCNASGRSDNPGKWGGYQRSLFLIIKYFRACAKLSWHGQRVADPMDHVLLVLLLITYEEGEERDLFVSQWLTLTVNKLLESRSPGSRYRRAARDTGLPGLLLGREATHFSSVICRDQS